MSLKTREMYHLTGMKRSRASREKTETLEQIPCGLTELVVIGNFKCTTCSDGGREAKIGRDLFTGIVFNDEVQKDLLAEKNLPN